MAICKGVEVPGDDPFPVPDDRSPWKVYPTDVSQFIRLNQCQRFLRLRLNEQQCGLDEFRRTGATPQTLPPLLAESGARFEGGIGETLRGTYPDVRDWTPPDPQRARPPDNDRLADAAERLPFGGTAFILQPSLVATIGNWRLSGRADVIRLDRDESGALTALVVDIKSSARASVEHRLQVAFYHEMLARIFDEAGVSCGGISTGVLYKGVRLEDLDTPDPELVRQRELAVAWFASDDAYLEIVSDPDSFLLTANDLLLGPHSVAQRVADAPFASLPFHLGSHCDRCVYNEFCLKDIVERDDLSLLPFLSDTEKKALQGCGVATMSELARLKRPVVDADGKPDLRFLEPASGQEETVRRVGQTWPVGPRIDELVHRARRYRRSRGDDYETRRQIPGKGRGSLPYSDAEHNPNLVRVYIEAQRDYIMDRLYLLSALVTGAREGEVPSWNRRYVVDWCDGPPEERDEASLLVRWIARVIQAIADVTEPGPDGVRKAPIHLIFPSATEQRDLLAALSRHAEEVVGATALYDFMTQQAGYDSPVLSLLDREVRDLKNVPILCQPMHIVAERFGFRWNDGDREYREIFRHRLFDYWQKEEAEDDSDTRFYVGKARFGGQVPLEYAYAAWGALPPPPDRGADDFLPYRRVTMDDLSGFARRRLEAMEHVATEFQGNRDTSKSEFVLPDLLHYEDRARSLAAALEEFLAIEKHVQLSGWKQVRYAQPERRALAGGTLPVVYRESDQEPAAAALNRADVAKWLEARAIEERFWIENPEAEKFRLDKDQKKALGWTLGGQTFRLRVSADGVDAEAARLAEVCGFKPGNTVIVAQRWHEDLRVPRELREPHTPTPKQLLYSMRATILEPGLREVDGAWVVDVELSDFMGNPSTKPWVFGQGFPFPFQEGVAYTLEEDPDNWNDFWQNKVVTKIRSGSPNLFYERLRERGDGPLQELPRPASAFAEQRRFLDGLRAFAAIGMANAFEESKEAFIGGHVDEPILLVQGPPGTGKSYTSGFAILARAQAALADEVPLFRALLSCKTHSAVDVLLGSVRDAIRELAAMRDADPLLFDEFFDPRLLSMDLFRLRPRDEVPDGIVPLPIHDDERAGNRAIDAVSASPLCVVAGTPGAIYRLLNKGRNGNLFASNLATLLVLDEASQMSLPEALMAALPLAPDAQIIVVGDHRQMPPIVKHDWESEQRKTFQDYAVYQSLFDVLQKPVSPEAMPDIPVVRFRKSFRLHRDIAEFLRQEIYRHDGIDFASDRDWTIDDVPAEDAYVRAVLAPDHPLVVVVHDEEASQQRNPFERKLVTPVAQALILAGFDLSRDFGVVVPHRAQRAELSGALAGLVGDDPAKQLWARSAVDTVERFQGGERRVIVISGTESDPGYLLAAGDFLYDPRRLTVALSRAKQKMILVASRQVFSMFSPQEETFTNTLIWKNLLHRTCTQELWNGTVEGVGVRVFGNGRA